MKNFKIMTLMSLVGGSMLLNAGFVGVTADVEVNTVVNSCASQRGNVKCSAMLKAKSKLEVGKQAGAGDDAAILGSIGEFETVSIPVTGAKNIGDVKENQSVIVENVLPGSPDVLAFKPTAGKLAGQEVYLAFKKVPKKAGTTQKFDKIDIYVRRADKAADQWFNAGEIIGGKDGVAAQKFILDTKGTLTTSAPNETDIVLSDLV